MRQCNTGEEKRRQERTRQYKQIQSNTRRNKARNQRLRRECCLKVVLEHPGAPNRWRRGPQEHPKGSQESPKRHRRAPKSTRSEAKRAPKSTQKEAKRAIESSKAIFVKKARDNRGQNRAPAEARARFSMPEKWRGANLFSAHFRSPGGSLGDPMGPRMRSEDVDDDQFDLS